ncbi:Smr/MutS family protein [Mycoplasmopsis opalescens]|uniref:Smr/MutS family protein n=1 Tax=Mycoplasmopsis opalescens TaxID=114886 RepID=UPI000690D679|nr:Smr/MutS family protein [Mycoplasmopsis opalescens]
MVFALNNYDSDVDNIIDLHGLRSDEAHTLIVMSIINAEIKKYYSIGFTTGKGTGALRTVLLDYLENEEYDYSYVDDKSMYIVYMKDFDQ